MKRKMLAASLLLWMFSLTAQADCAVLGPGKIPRAGLVLGPTVCECP
ncbi:PA0050 family protein [Pseudomonas aeruginosa]